MLPAEEVMKIGVVNPLAFESYSVVTSRISPLDIT